MKRLEYFGSCTALIFICLFILFVPFPYHILFNTGSWLEPLIKPAIQWTGKEIFGLTHFSDKLMSDTTGMYILVFLMLLVSLAWAAGLTRSWKQPSEALTIRFWLNKIATYFLSLQLLIYGFAKIFKTQFYLPEPNTLFTASGHMHKDLLYWTLVGSSHSFSVFSGCMEVVPALLILFKKTRRLGAFWLLAVCTYILALNFCFDISVKVLSALLWLLSLIIALPYLGKNEWEEGKPTIKPIQYAIIKSTAIGIILLESLFVYFRYNNFNDDAEARPLLHGAYEVQTFVINHDTLPPLTTDKYRFRRIFIHRQGYFIAQKMDDKMISFRLEYDPAHNGVTLNETHLFHYTVPGPDSILTLKGKLNKDSLFISAKKLDINKLPLLQHQFHWVIDQGY